MTKTTLNSTNSTAPGTSEKLSTPTPSNILNVASPKGPWNRPELEKSVDYVLDNLRETKHMINSLQEREKRLKAEVSQLHEQGKLDHLIDADDPQKFNGDGVTVALCQGRTKRIYDEIVQMELDAKQQEIDRIKYKADRLGSFTDKVGPSHWRVSLAKDEVL